jgi:hypothetical protein
LEAGMDESYYKDLIGTLPARGGHVIAGG